MSRFDVTQYQDLLQRFDRSEIGVEEFVQRYFALSKNDPRILPEPIYECLNDMFIACDDFVADPSLRDPGDLDEAGLRVAVRKALSVLRRVSEELIE